MMVDRVLIANLLIAAILIVALAGCVLWRYNTRERKYHRRLRREAREHDERVARRQDEPDRRT